MAVKFDYTATLRNAFLLNISSSAGVYTSDKTTTSGIFYEKFRALFNPGHQNNSSAFEYHLSFMNFAASSYKWEFQQRGSTAWVKFSTGIGMHGLTAKKTGTWSSSALALPIQFKLSMKGTSNYILISNYSTYLCAVRSWGPIAT